MLIQMRRSVLLAVIAIVVVGAVAGALLYRPAAPKVRVGYIPAASYGLLWVAYENGYFTQEGLDVTLKEYPDVGRLVSALASGEIDGAPITSVAIAAFIGRIDASIVAGNSLDGTALVTNAAVSQLSDLNGLTVGTVQYVPGDFIFKKVIAANNINVTFREYVTPSDALFSLEAKNVDVALLWEPYATLAEYRQLRLALWDENVYSKDYPCCLQVFTNSFLRANPDAASKFIKALIRAEVLCYTNSSAAFPLVKKYLPTMPNEIVYGSVFEIDPDLQRARNPLSAYMSSADLQEFYSMLVPSIMTQNDYALLLSRIDTSYYVKAINALKSEGFSLPERYS